MRSRAGCRSAAALTRHHTSMAEAQVDADIDGPRDRFASVLIALVEVIVGAIDEQYRALIKHVVREQFRCPMAPVGTELEVGQRIAGLIASGLQEHRALGIARVRATDLGMTLDTRGPGEVVAGDEGAFFLGHERKLGARWRVPDDAGLAAGSPQAERLRQMRIDVGTVQAQRPVLIGTE